MKKVLVVLILLFIGGYFLNKYKPDLFNFKKEKEIEKIEDELKKDNFERIETNKEDIKSNQEKKDVSYFKREVKKIVPNLKEDIALYSMEGTVNGYKLYLSNNNKNYLEIYDYDIASEGYEKALLNKKICMIVNTNYSICFDGIVEKGYGLILSDEFPNQEKVKSLFKELEGK